LKSFQFDPSSLMMILVQRTKIPFIVQDVLTGFDVRDGIRVWGPSETGFVHSRFIGVAFGHLVFIGRDLPPYYSRKTEQITKARYFLFAVNSSSGVVSVSTQLPQTLYTDNTQENSIIC